MDNDQKDNDQMGNDPKDNDQMGNDQMDYDHMDNALPTSSTRPNISSRPQKKFSCGQGTCDYSADRRYNVIRHQINSCRWVPEKEWKLKERTCELCGQLLSARKLVKPHQRTNYCQNQQKRKRQGLDVQMYKYSEWISCILLVLMNCCGPSIICAAMRKHPEQLRSLYASENKITKFYVHLCAK
jgi:hypothetical protein